MSTIIFSFVKDFPNDEKRIQSVIEKLYINPIVTFNNDFSGMTIKMVHMTNHLQAIISIVCDMYPVTRIVYVQ